MVELKEQNKSKVNVRVITSSGQLTNEELEKILPKKAMPYPDYYPTEKL